MTVKDAAANSLLMFVAATCVVLIVKAIEPAPSARDNTPTSEATGGKVAGTPTLAMRDGVRVYYLHGNIRCPTCRTIEAYAEEAVQSGFANELKTATIEWRVVNYETPGNEHFATDYNIVAPNVVLVRFQDGKQVAWKGLSQVWELTGNKAKFLAFVQTSLRDFLEGEETKTLKTQKTPLKPVPASQDAPLPIPD